MTNERIAEIAGLLAEAWLDGRVVGKPEDDLLVRRIKGYREFRQQIKRLQKLQDQLAGDWKRLEKSLVAKS